MLVCNFKSVQVRTQVNKYFILICDFSLMAKTLPKGHVVKTWAKVFASPIINQNSKKM